MYGFYIYHSFSFVGFEYQTVGWRSGWLLVSSSSPVRENLKRDKILILSTTDICKLLTKKNLSVSVTLTSLRLQSQATYQLSIISMGPAPDWHFSPTHPCTFLFTFFLQIWTLLIWQTAKYCLTINLAMGENFLRDLGGETVNGSQCSGVCVPVVNKFDKLCTKSFPNTPPQKWVFASVLDWSPWATN